MTASQTVPETPESAPGAPRRGRVRLRRFAAVMIPAAAAGAGLVVLTAQGVIAAQFSISGMPFTVTADRLDGSGFEQFGALDNTAPGSPNLQDQNGQVVVVQSVIKSATLTNLCQSVSLGLTNLVIRAGRGGTPVSAANLVVDSDKLSGDATFANISVDQDASTLTEVPGITGPLGTFGQQADHVTIDHLRQNNWATSAVSFTLPGLDLGFSGNGC
jgi:Family of unknown function (DUF6230)